MLRNICADQEVIVYYANSTYNVSLDAHGRAATLAYVQKNVEADEVAYGPRTVRFIDLPNTSWAKYVRMGTGDETGRVALADLADFVREFMTASQDDIHALMNAKPVEYDHFLVELRHNRAIHAIKLVREVTSCSLKEAKDYWDAHRRGDYGSYIIQTLGDIDLDDLAMD